MKVPAGGLSQQQFDDLPPTLQRKYFSSLERLRLAQDGAFPPPLSSRKVRLQPRGSNSPDLRFRIPQRRMQYLTRSSSRRLLRNSQSIRSQYRASRIDASWFSSLPHKIQQRQFTREEQVLFAGNREAVILDAADEALYRLGRQPSLRTAATFQTGPRPHILDLDAEPSDDSSLTMDKSFYDNFRWLEGDEDIDLKLDDYHNAMAETARPATAGQPYTSSFLRTMSLTSLEPRRPSLALDRLHSSHSNLPTLGPIASVAPARPSSSLITPGHKRHFSVPSIDPSAKHYQDPEARLKLRVYLASPQKFDEAIEFGFPSLDTAAPARHVTPAGTPRRTQETERSFLDDSPSLTQEHGEDSDADGSMPESESPRTPQDTIFHSPRTSKQNNRDRAEVCRPYILRGSPDSYTQNASGLREMTLHMTLTRPDLRTEEKMKPGIGTHDDPLRLSPLLLSDESHPVWELGPENRSKMKRLWRKLISR